MKHIILIFLAAPFFSFAQNPELHIINGHYLHESTFSIPGKSKSILYQIANQWVATDIKDQRRISQTDSKDTGKIIEKIRFNTLYEGGTDLINETTVTIECSNEKIKIKLSNFQYSIGSDTSKVIIDNIIQFAAPEQIARHRMWYPIDRTATEIIANFRTWLKSKL